MAEVNILAPINHASKAASRKWNPRNGVKDTAAPLAKPAAMA